VPRLEQTLQVAKYEREVEDSMKKQKDELLKEMVRALEEIMDVASAKIKKFARPIR